MTKTLRSVIGRASQVTQRVLYPDVAIPLVTAAIVVVLLVMAFGK